MPRKNSHWRVNDVVAHDRMRESAIEAFAILARTVQAEGPRADNARVELTVMWGDVLTVDAYDRAAVTALAERIEDLISDFEGDPS